MTLDVMSQIKAALAAIPDPPKGLVEGLLLVTQEQYDALLDLADSEPLDYLPPQRSRLGDIQVVLVAPNWPVTLPSGRIAVCFDGSIYLVPAQGISPERH